MQATTEINTMHPQNIFYYLCNAFKNHRLYRMTLKNSTTGLAFFLIFMALMSVTTKGQAQPCDIQVIGTTLPVCPNTFFQLAVEDAPNRVYTWQKQEGGTYVTVGTDPILDLELQDSSVYKVTVIDTLIPDTCWSLPFGIGVRPPIEVTFFQRDSICSTAENAKVKATAGNAFPANEYHYLWEIEGIDGAVINPTDSTEVWGLKARQNYSILVTDPYGCRHRATYKTFSYPNLVIEITAEPNDTVYLQNPMVTYSYENLSADSIVLNPDATWWEIIEGDTTTESKLQAPSYKYNSTGEFITYLYVKSDKGCDTVYATSVLVKPIELFIPNIITPGDGKYNNEFTITTVEDKDKGTVGLETLSRFYQSSRLVVFNRLGRKVFEAENYDNKWDGDNLPDGVYYYVLECHGAKSTDVFKGSLTIVRSN